ncbi:MAG: type II secretion system protein [Nitriliruptoraceae bacterium]
MAQRSGSSRIDGLSLVEMIVSIAILGVLLGGLSATMVNVLDLSRNNANRVVAANLAASAIEELRTRPYTELEDLADSDPNDTWTREVDGQEFTLSREVFWSTNLADAGSCLGSIGPADENILRLTIDVTWNRPGSIPPVRSETAISPPVSPDSSSSGTIAVFVADHQSPPQPVSGVEVTLTGPAPSTAERRELTDGDGCAVFQSLTRGSYEASLDKSAPAPYAYVDLDQQVSPDVAQSIGTAPRIWANLEFRYAVSGALSVDVEGWSPGSRLPVEPLPWYAANERDGSPYVFASTGDAEQLYPGLYDIGVGHCTDAEVSPQVSDAAVVESGVQLQHDATIGSFEVRWSQAVLDALGEDGVSARTVDLVAIPPAQECFDGAGEVDLPGILEGEVATYALPFADGWTVEARIGDTTLDAASLDLAPEDDPMLPVVEFDYEIDVDPSVPGCGGLFDVLPTVLQATGGVTEVITVDGSPWCLHRFEDVGAAQLEVTGGTGDVEYLVVGGGGGGAGNRNGNVGRGGGGAGGMLEGVLSLSGPGTTDVRVGAGGAGGVNSADGEDGKDSRFGSIVALGGGGGGNFEGTAGDGGSGGGEGVDGDGPGEGVPGQGNDGGSGSGEVRIGRGGGGGGGAGSAGASVPDWSNRGGDGGDGLSSDITGASVAYAGGGGGSGGESGGAGGLGGGGRGSDPSSRPQAGTPNRGGGGGGGTGFDGAPGGSGVVYVRYPLEDGTVVPPPGGCDTGPVSFDLTSPGAQSVTVPANCTAMTVEAWGGGGGGGSPAPGSGWRPSGHGGGGGAFAGGTFAVTPGQLVVADVGAGGAANEDGAPSTLDLAGARVLVAAAGEAGTTSGTTPGLGGSVTDSLVAGGAQSPTRFAGGDGGERGTFADSDSTTPDPDGLWGGGGGGGGSGAPTGSGSPGDPASAQRGGDGGSGAGNGGDGGDDEAADDDQAPASGAAPGGGGGGTGWVRGSPVAGSGADGRVVITWSAP